MIVFAQLFPGGPFTIMLWIIFLFIFMFFYPKLMTAQLVWGLEREVRQIELWDRQARQLATKKISKTKRKKLKNAVKRFSEFFMIRPVSLDPRGIVEKVDRIIADQRTRFKRFVKQWSDKNLEEQASLRAGLESIVASHQLAKIIRHNLELVKQLKNMQLAMMLKMQMPLIKRLQRAITRGTRPLCDSEPIGDGAGPLVAAQLITGRAEELEDYDILFREQQIAGRRCIVVKAKGPGGRTGQPGKALKKLIDRFEPARIITVDAAAKLEGERTGSTAEGIGVAMGGFGVERFAIEKIAEERKIPLDAIAIKMRREEAFYSMKKSILEATDKAVEAIKRSLERVPEGKQAIILGVGNSCGVENSRDELDKTSKKIEKNVKRMKRQKRREEEKKGLLQKLSEKVEGFPIAMDLIFARKAQGSV